MKTCKKCNKQIDGTFGSGIFCSRGCANSRKFSKQAIQKKRIAALGKPNARRGLKLSHEELNLRREKIKATYSTKRNSAPFTSLSHRNKRKVIIEQQSGKCAQCGIASWNGLPITLEIDHKDNNKNNNSRENLVGLCPNCHSQTIGWRKGWKYKTVGSSPTEGM